MKEDIKLTVAMVASLIAVVLIVVQFFVASSNNIDQEYLLGSTIGGERNPVVCLWQMGGNYQMMSQSAFCNRLFSRYASEGECVGTADVVEFTDKQNEAHVFGYDGYCGCKRCAHCVLVFCFNRAKQFLNGVFHCRALAPVAHATHKALPVAFDC